MLHSLWLKMMIETSKQVPKVKSVVAFLQILVTLVLSRPFGTITLFEVQSTSKSKSGYHITQ